MSSGRVRDTPMLMGEKSINANVVLRCIAVAAGHDQLHIASLQPDWSMLRVGAALISARSLMPICSSCVLIIFFYTLGMLVSPIIQQKHDS